MVKNLRKTWKNPGRLWWCHNHSGEELTRGFVWALVFENQLFLPPSNPKHELASPCLGTHAQKP